MSDVGRGMFVGAILSGVVFFGLGAAAGSVIEDGKIPIIEIGGHIYDDCHKIDTHTWKCL